MGFEDDQEDAKRYCVKCENEIDIDTLKCGICGAVMSDD